MIMDTVGIEIVLLQKSKFFIYYVHYFVDLKHIKFFRFLMAII